MNTIKRHIDHAIKSHFDNGRQILLLLGARQVGKTTLLKRIFPHAQYFLLDSDPILKSFETYDINTYKQLIKSPDKYVILDEIQLLSNPGRAGKIIYDLMPDIKLIVTGSSALNIKNKTSESMAGRKLDYYLYPLTFSEYLYQTGIEDMLNKTFLSQLVSPILHKKAYPFDIKWTLSRVLTYGLHPYLIEHSENQAYLQELVNSFIYRDIEELNLIEDRSVANDLLKLLAYQIGNLINYAELASKLHIDVRTVKRYITIFEQSFIIFRLNPFTSNRRDEIGKSPKIYFYDLGVRNAIINDFSEPLMRRDAGAIFENFIISEALKHNNYIGKVFQLAFWRTTQGAEVDLVLHNHNEVIGCEIKLSKGRITSSFAKRFPTAKTKLINVENFY